MLDPKNGARSVAHHNTKLLKFDDGLAWAR